MQSDFEIITNFLSRCLADVQGRGSDVPDKDVLLLFRKFASGKATSEERAEVVSLVDSRPDWIAALADEIKQRRETTKSTVKA
jgi:hypothetical protein